MVNLAYNMLFLFGKFVQYIFFGKLRDIESKVYKFSKYFNYNNIESQVPFFSTGTVSFVILSILAKRSPYIFSFLLEYQRPFTELHTDKNFVYWCNDGSWV